MKTFLLACWKLFLILPLAAMLVVYVPICILERLLDEASDDIMKYLRWLD